jgi:hypothetical protein
MRLKHKLVPSITIIFTNLLLLMRHRHTDLAFLGHLFFFLLLLEIAITIRGWHHWRSEDCPSTRFSSSLLELNV